MQDNYQPESMVNETSEKMINEFHLKFIKLKEDEKINFFDIIGVSTRELSHSSFLAWLLNPRASHKLGVLFWYIKYEIPLSF
ncbi:MAG: PD-(D/E)XK nuclease family protein [Nanoarchaeota archaeon]